MPEDMTLVSTEDLLEELKKRAEHIFLTASFPDAQAKAPPGHTGFLTIIPGEPQRLLRTIQMVGQAFKAIARGDQDTLQGIIALFLASAIEGGLDD